MPNPIAISVHPLTTARWHDFTALFGKKGACGGCWCMLWRLSRKKFEAQKGDGNKQAMKAIVGSGVVPGLLAYDGQDAVGWISLGPRESFPALARSRILKPVDDRPVWSVSCFFIDKKYRRKGVSVPLLTAAARYAAEQGAGLLEGYPVEPKPDKAVVPAFVWTGLAGTFLSAGFQEVARRSPTRPIMRTELDRR